MTMTMLFRPKNGTATSKFYFLVKFCFFFAELYALAVTI